MWRVWGLLCLALLTPVLLVMVTLRHEEADGRQWAAERQARDIAALRPPPMQPSCPSYFYINGVRSRAEDFASVRVFSFGSTVYYVPAQWLALKPPSSWSDIGGIDRDALGALVPDLHVNECPGVVHQVTNAGLYLQRFMGVGFSPGREALGSDNLRPLRNVAFIYAQKLRNEGDNIREAGVPSYLEDGFQESFDHQRLDAYAYLAPDLGWRIGWHPGSMSEAAWEQQFENWHPSSGRPTPWATERRTAEFQELMVAARKLHAWLTTPPKLREPIP